jgi:hypothetical protein
MNGVAIRSEDRLVATPNATTQLVVRLCELTLCKVPGHSWTTVTRLLGFLVARAGDRGGGFI